MGKGEFVEDAAEWERFERSEKSRVQIALFALGSDQWQVACGEQKQLVAEIPGGSVSARGTSCAEIGKVEIRSRDMQSAIPLEVMATMEKPRAIDDIWADLACAGDDVSFPAWHADILHAREKRIANGTSRFLDIEEAKQAVQEYLK